MNCLAVPRATAPDIADSFCTHAIHASQCPAGVFGVWSFVFRLLKEDFGDLVNVENPLASDLIWFTFRFKIIVLPAICGSGIETFIDGA